MVRCTAAVLIAFLVTTPAVYAEPPAAPIRAGIERIRFDRLSTASPKAPQARFQQQHKPMSVATKATVGVLGGALGFVVGGAVGAGVGGAFGPNCGCDMSPSAGVGFLIGAPVGAVVGAIGAIKLASR